MIQILQHTMKGPIPNWYNKVKNKITDANTYNLQDSWTSLPWEEQLIQTISVPKDQDGRFKNWYIWQEPTNNNQIHWGRSKGSISRSNRMLIHYISSIDLLTENVTLKKCHRCTLNNPKENNKNPSNTCLVQIDRSVQVYMCDLLNGTGRLRSAPEPRIPCNLETLEKLVRENIYQKKHYKQPSAQPQVIIQE